MWRSWITTSVGSTSLVNRLTTRARFSTRSGGVRPRSARMRSRIVIAGLLGTWFYHSQSMALADLVVPRRLTAGGGPSTPDDRVLRALTTPLIGQFDPAFTHVMDEVMQLARSVLLTDNARCFAISGLPSSGIEALLNTLPPDVGYVVGVHLDPTTGELHDLRGLAQACHERGALLLVDA